jgi:hypothetical protein
MPLRDKLTPLPSCFCSVSICKSRSAIRKCAMAVAIHDDDSRGLVLGTPLQSHTEPPPSPARRLTSNRATVLLVTPSFQDQNSHSYHVAKQVPTLGLKVARCPRLLAVYCSHRAVATNSTQHLPWLAMATHRKEPTTMLPQLECLRGLSDESAGTSQSIHRLFLTRLLVIAKAVQQASMLATWL